MTQTTIQSDVLALFNCLVISDDQETERVYLGLATKGLVLDFAPKGAQLTALEEVYKPLPMTTLFSKDERLTANLADLIVKQLLHYVEVYGLDSPGLFNLEVDNGTIASFNYVTGITFGELTRKVQKLLYAGAPVKDAEQLKRIIAYFHVTFNINSVANNELRVLLWNEAFEPFENGDDVVRYMCAQATGRPLLIKSKEVIAAVKKHDFPVYFFTMHEVPLAQVFNRHKALILAAKNKSTTSVINRISRKSKTAHVPVRESIAKTFIHEALTGKVIAAHVLNIISIRDKFKYLNVLAEKKIQSRFGLFQIRNGKVWYDEDRKVYGMEEINIAEKAVLESLTEDLAHLKGKNILIDPAVDYGLPTTRKQTLGRLPFGTRVISTGNEISSGMYWENSWGARDLDLSGITLAGHRVGWGSYSSYRDEGIIFSGDITSAPNGAMEFMTSKSQDYGICVNIFSGKIGSEMELVVGEVSKTKKSWLDKIVIREKVKLESKNCLLGFVKGKTFTVYGGRMNNKIVSGANPTLRAMEVRLWTVQDLFGRLQINYDVDKQDEVEYDHDLSYSSFSYDALEALFNSST